MKHSKAYHSFFEGYTEYAARDAKTGRVHIRRVYTGYYYRPDLEPGACRALRARYAGLYLLAWVTFVGAGTLALPGTAGLVLTLPVAAALLSLIWGALPMLDYLTGGPELEQRVYRGMKQLSSAALAGCISLAVCAAALLVCAAIFPENLLSQVAGALCAAVGAVSLYLLYHTEKNMIYTRRRSEAVCGGEGREVTCAPEDA